MIQRESGFVSLLTCIMLSMLLMVITMSFVGLQTLQLRKSEDSEQTLRAYYAAEAGMEDAVNKVLSGQITSTVGADQCNKPGVAYDAPGIASWTCQQVSFSGNPTGKLEKADSAKTIDPGNVNYSSVVIEWNQSPSRAATYFSPLASLTAGNFPSAAAFAAQPFVPPLEVSIVRYPRTTLKASDVPTQTDIQNVVIVPAGVSVNPTVNYPQAGHGPWAADCSLARTASTSYNCMAVISGFGGPDNYLFRVRSRYDASAYRLTFMTGANGNGVAVPVADGTATIDVTAKAGVAYRRMISKLPLTTSAAAGLNFVIYSDTDVCKNLQVFDNDTSSPINC